MVGTPSIIYLVRSHAAPAGGAVLRRLMAGRNSAMERCIIATSGHIRSLRSTGADSSIAQVFAEIVDVGVGDFREASWGGRIACTAFQARLILVVGYQIQGIANRRANPRIKNFISLNVFVKTRIFVIFIY